MIKPFYVTEAINAGQIACGKVIPFDTYLHRTMIPLPPNARPFDKFLEYEVFGNSLENLGIKDGDLLTCRRNFEQWEIKPQTVCIVRIIPTNDTTAKMVKNNDDGTILIYGASDSYKPQIYFENEIEILAIAIEYRRKL